MNLVPWRERRSEIKDQIEGWAENLDFLQPQ